MVKTIIPQSNQPNMTLPSSYNGANSGSPDDSTLEKDVFDGIEDIYADLEANPPQAPPSSKNDITEAQRLNSSYSSSSTSSSTSSVGMNKIVKSEESVKHAPGFPYLCDTPMLKNMWNIFKAQNYHEMEENDEKSTEMDLPPNTEVTDTHKNQTENEIKTKNIMSVKNAVLDTVEGRDTIIRYTIHDNEVQRNIDEEKIRKKKLEKYFPSFWEVLGQRKLFGVSYRMLLLIGLSLIALILLIILVSTPNKSDSITESNTNSNNSTADASFNASLAEEESGNDENITSELRALCEEQGVTAEDGVILTANQTFERGEYFCSPSKTYILGMMDDLAIVDVSADKVVWSAGVTDGARTILQDDGNMIIESEEGDVLWNAEVATRDTGFTNPQLVFWENNEGVIALQHTPTVGVGQNPFNFWMDGIPRSEYCDDCQAADNLQFPVRGTFYYPTFENDERSWQDGPGNTANYYPSLGFYSSSDPAVVSAHVDAMEYGKINLAIASWFGPETNYDRSRITMLLEESTKQNTDLKWTVTYETERRGRQNEEDIQSDLDYLKKWFVWQDSWARVDGKPVIYVNGGGCDVAERWMTGHGNDWYIVLRAFDGYERCEYQPDAFYNRRVNSDNDGIDSREGLYYNIAPGQWRMGRQRANLDRLSAELWCDHVQGMMDSNEKWQHIVSFNDAFFGTSIEPSLEWSSASIYGIYLDCLHDPEMF